MGEVDEKTKSQNLPMGVIFISNAAESREKNGVCVTLLLLSISRAHIFFLSHQTRYVVALTGIICCQASRDTTTYKQKRESSVNTVHKMPICGLGKE